MKRFFLSLLFLALSVSAFAAGEVRLEFAKDVSFTLAHARVIHQIVGQVEVANIAYEKRVSVVYTLDGTTWQEAQASFVRSLEGNRDQFIFAIVMPESDYNGGAYNSRWARFAVRYEVNGRVYWDNNGGKDYYISTKGDNRRYSRMILGSSNIRLMGARGYYRWGTQGCWYIQGEVAVRNLAFNKDIKLVYTVDGWKTTLTGNLMYLRHEGDHEVWRFDFLHPDPLLNQREDAQYEFAISYTVNGQTWWDNNNGSNYRMEISGWIGMDLWYK